MTDAVLNTLITTIGSTLTSGIGCVAVYMIRQTHNLVNSRMTEMLAIKDEVMAIAVKASKAEGAKEEKDNPSL